MKHTSNTNPKGVKFFVAECMEFPSMGKRYEEITTIQEAYEIFKKIPDCKKNMGNGIGVVVLDEVHPRYGGGEYSLLDCGMVDDLSLYGKKIRENEEIQKAVEYLKAITKNKDEIETPKAKKKHIDDMER